MRGKCSPGCPQCYANVRGRSSYRGHRCSLGRRTLRTANVRSFMQRPASRGDGDVPGGRGRDVELHRLYPCLAAHVCDDRWDDGAARVPSTLFIFHDGSRFKVMLKDREAETVAFLSSETFQGLLEGLEVGLANGTLDWRVDRQSNRRKR